MIRLYATVLCLCGLAVTAAACGVPTENTARPLATTDAAQAFVEPVARTAGPASEHLYLVNNGSLIRVERKLSAPPSIQQLVSDLMAGPTEAEEDVGFTSALLGTHIIGAVDASATTAVVDLSSTREDTGRNDDVLAFAQVVCTLTARPGVKRVAFTREGHPVGVPRADGALTDTPLTCADYTSLLTW
ncbi:GerMN domain-containing protein [Catellatospora tritici]|uniref:GerMN domain-containing protein n=1 Tax=Catellatospora tritici TaxID=2851566 RepID=UPI001C2D3AAD|nr:GerMN domain-containing protein [Catellatospora tritici]MBV1851214.1 GerMN domain-containing protein [Catellatospora tritici]